MEHRKAKQTVCPMLSNQDFKVKCLGRDCIMWQWDETLIVNPNAGNDDQVARLTGSCGLKAK